MGELDLEPAKPGRVLLVEDDPQVGETLKLVLEQDAHNVRLAPDVATASRLLGEQRVDVVVSDIYMPGLTGLDLLTSLRRASVDVEVILMSGEPTLDTAREALRQGAFDYLTKPISGRALRRVVAEAIERRRQRERAGEEREDERHRLRALEQAVERRTQELAESRERYRQLVEGLPLLVYEWDCATRRFTYTGGSLAAALRMGARGTTLARSF